MRVSLARVKVKRFFFFCFFAPSCYIIEIEVLTVTYCETYILIPSAGSVKADLFFPFEINLGITTCHAGVGAAPP